MLDPIVGMGRTCLLLLMCCCSWQQVGIDLTMKHLLGLLDVLGYTL